MLSVGTKRSHNNMVGTITSDTPNTRIEFRFEHTSTDLTSNCTVGVTERTGDLDLVLPPIVPLEQEDDLPPPLYPHQLHAINQVIKALDEGDQRIGVSAATGSGKTATFVSMLQYIPKRGRGQKVMILVPTLMILEQVLVECRSRLPAAYRVDIEQAGTTPPDNRAHIIIATWQSLSKERILKYNPADFKCIIVDEAHHSPADSYLRQLFWFNEDVSMHNELIPFVSPYHGQKVPIVGFSGTMARHDERPLGLVYQKVVYHIDMLTLIQKNRLVPIKLESVWPEVRRLQHQARMTDHQLAQSPQFLGLLVDTYVKYASNRRSTLVFCPKVETAKLLTELFQLAGVAARYIALKTSKSARRGIVENFKNKKFDVLVNCKIFTEGADLPPIDAVILANPTRNPNLVNQMLGRGTRLSPQTHKVDCILLDMFDVLGQYGIGAKPSLEPNSSKK